MSDKRETGLVHGAPIGLCLPQLGREAKGTPDRQKPAENDDRESGTGDRRLLCALEMELTNCSMHGDSKVDCVNCDGLISRNGGDSAEVSVPLTLPGKRITPMEGDNLYRLRDRKFLLEDKKRLCALALGTALLGIVLMIIHAEICPSFYEPQTAQAQQNLHLGFEPP